jgi:hypothetical protein
LLIFYFILFWGGVILFLFFILCRALCAGRFVPGAARPPLSARQNNGRYAGRSRSAGH